MFKSDIFFSRCSIFVEGASDASVPAAISDLLGSIFEKYDIYVADPGGKDNMDKYKGIISSYEINHITGAGNQKQTSSLFCLEN